MIKYWDLETSDCVIKKMLEPTFIINVPKYELLNLSPCKNLLLI